MKTRAAVAWKAGDPLTIESLDLEGPRAGEVLVEVKATGICHTDWFTLSGGEKKLLSFVRGLSEAQPLLLLDEPSEGVQWENIEHMVAALAQAKAAGRSFVVVEQNLAFAEAIADAYLVIDQGRVVRQGRHAELGRAKLLEYLHV